jgi:uncharacterized protein (TIGR03435 family)
MKWRWGVALLVVALGIAIRAQSQETPRFDVASVKPNHSVDEESASFVQPGGRYIATNVTVRMLLKSAYGLHDNQILGGPTWINSERFDISAKADGYSVASAFRDAARLMLRPLLADRFKLILRHEQRELPVYALILARGDGTLGPQLRRAEPRECDRQTIAVAPGPGAPEPGIPLICGAEVYRPGHLAARGMALSNLVLNVSRWTDRVVVDQTNLEGKFDWDLQWTPDQADTAPSPEGPLLFAALRDQAGFRMERQRRPVDVIVIESVQIPDPD